MAVVTRVVCLIAASSWTKAGAAACHSGACEGQSIEDHDETGLLQLGLARLHSSQEPAAQGPPAVATEAAVEAAMPKGVEEGEHLAEHGHPEDHWHPEFEGHAPEGAAHGYPHVDELGHSKEVEHHEHPEDDVVPQEVEEHGHTEEVHEHAGDTEHEHAEDHEHEHAEDVEHEHPEDHGHPEVGHEHPGAMAPLAPAPAIEVAPALSAAAGCVTGCAGASPAVVPLIVPLPVAKAVPVFSPGDVDAAASVQAPASSPSPAPVTIPAPCGGGCAGAAGGAVVLPTGQPVPVPAPFPVARPIEVVVQVPVSAHAPAPAQAPAPVPVPAPQPPMEAEGNEVQPPQALPCAPKGCDAPCAYDVDLKGMGSVTCRDRVGWARYNSPHVQPTGNLAAAISLVNDECSCQCACEEGDFESADPAPSPVATPEVEPPQPESPPVEEHAQCAPKGCDTPCSYDVDMKGTGSVTCRDRVEWARYNSPHVQPVGNLAAAIGLVNDECSCQCACELGDFER